MRGNWWRGAGIMIVAALLLWAVGIGLIVLFTFVPFVGPILTAVVQSAFAAYAAILLVVLYFDLRCRHEDFDVQYLAQQITRTPEEPPGPSPDPIG